MPSTPSRPRVYLAGPDVFFPESRQIFDALRAACDHCGLIGVEPSDGGLATGFKGSDEDLAQRIFDGNIDLIRSADGVIANLVNFRGHEPDSGTVFEVGFARALGKPVVAYGVAQESYADRVGRTIACARDGHGVIREIGNGAMVEGLGQRLNLMLTRSVEIAPSPVAALERLAVLLQSSAPR